MTRGRPLKYKAPKVTSVTGEDLKFQLCAKLGASIADCLALGQDTVILKAMNEGDKRITKEDWELYRRVMNWQIDEAIAEVNERSDIINDKVGDMIDAEEHGREVAEALERGDPVQHSDDDDLETLSDIVRESFAHGDVKVWYSIYQQKRDDPSDLHSWLSRHVQGSIIQRAPDNKARINLIIDRNGHKILIDMIRYLNHNFDKEPDYDAD